MSEEPMNDIITELEDWHGYSSYELALQHGFVGTEEEYLQSLHGRDGGVETVCGVEHDEDGEVPLTAADIPVSGDDARTLDEIVETVDGLAGAMEVTEGGDIDMGGHYILNALFL